MYIALVMYVYQECCSVTFRQKAKVFSLQLYSQCDKYLLAIQKYDRSSCIKGKLKQRVCRQNCYCKLISRATPIDISISHVTSHGSADTSSIYAI